jgi:hypothetical protein
MSRHFSGVDNVVGHAEAVLNVPRTPEDVPPPTNYLGQRHRIAETAGYGDSGTTQTLLLVDAVSPVELACQAAEKAGAQHAIVWTYPIDCLA